VRLRVLRQAAPALARRPVLRQAAVSAVTSARLFIIDRLSLTHLFDYCSASWSSGRRRLWRSTRPSSRLVLFATQTHQHGRSYDTPFLGGFGAPPGPPAGGGFGAPPGPPAGGGFGGKTHSHPPRYRTPPKLTQLPTRSIQHRQARQTVEASRRRQRAASAHYRRRPICRRRPRTWARRRSPRQLPRRRRRSSTCRASRRSRRRRRSRPRRIRCSLRSRPRSRAVCKRSISTPNARRSSLAAAPISPRFSPAPWTCAEVCRKPIVTQTKKTLFCSLFVSIAAMANNAAGDDDDESDDGWDDSE
jgi:hypothetical protein